LDRTRRSIPCTTSRNSQPESGACAVLEYSLPDQAVDLAALHPLDRANAEQVQAALDNPRGQIAE
jgi:hypothetical protein